VNAHKVIHQQIQPKY